MYKRIKITKRIGLAIEKFRYECKNLITIPMCYHNGIHVWKDDLNGICFYCITISTFRIVLDIQKDRYCSCG